jgi:hypothetical protein
MQSAGLNDLRGPGAWATYSAGIAPKNGGATANAGPAAPATQPVAAAPVMSGDTTVDAR